MQIVLLLRFKILVSQSMCGKRGQCFKIELNYCTFLKYSITKPNYWNVCVGGGCRCDLNECLLDVRVEECAGVVSPTDLTDRAGHRDR